MSSTEGLGKEVVASARSALKPCNIVCPPERHIAAQFHEVFGIVKGSMSVSVRQRYEEVCMLIECLYSQEFMTLRRSLFRNLNPFSTGAKGQALVTRVGKALPPKADLDMREQKLVADILQLMAAARYHIMTREEWEVALAESFMFDLPVAVNWDFFDNRLLSRFWDSSRERQKLRSVLPDCADRVLVFHRGIGLAEDSGLYINQKLNLLVEYIVVQPAKKVTGWVRSKWPSWPRSKKKTNVSVVRPPSTKHSQPAARPGTAAAQSPGGTKEASLDEDDAPAVHRNAKVVERRTLPRLMPTAWSVIQAFPRTLKIQEPMLKEVVVLYRASGKGRADAKKNKVPPRGRSSTERLRDILNLRNIHIKQFHDIPMADIEAVFPDKKVYLRTLSIINMVIQAITAFVAAIATLWKAGSLDLHTIWSAVSLVAARCGQLYSSMQAERSQMVQDMVSLLYDKTQDAQEGVISMLLEDMAEQQLKEAVLAYTLLYMNIEDELSQEKLDDLCEGFLEQHFSLRLDFAVEDALPRLVKWGLVKENSRTGLFQAVPVDVAYQLLVEEWVKAYQALSKPPVTNELPLSTLLPGGEKELARSLASLQKAHQQANLIPPIQLTISEVSTPRDEAAGQVSSAPSRRVTDNVCSPTDAIEKDASSALHSQRVSRSFQSSQACNESKAGPEGDSVSPKHHSAVPKKKGAFSLTSLFHRSGKGSNASLKAASPIND